jgi:hypothetical protein
MATLIRDTQLNIEDTQSDFRSLVAREGTELAEALRARGWQARAGWRRIDDAGEPVWFVRFEQPADDMQR